MRKTFTKNYRKIKLWSSWSSIFICDTSDPRSSSESTVFFRVHGLLPSSRSSEHLSLCGASRNPSAGGASCGSGDWSSIPWSSGESTRCIEDPVFCGCDRGARSQVRPQHVRGFLVGHPRRMFLWGSSTSIGWRTLLTADANSDSEQAYQSSVMFITSWTPSSSLIDCFKSAGA